MDFFCMMGLLSTSCSFGFSSLPNLCWKIKKTRRIQSNPWHHITCQFCIGSIDMMSNLLMQANKNHHISKIVQEKRISQMKTQLFYGCLNQKLSFLTDNMLNDNSLILMCWVCMLCSYILQCQQNVTFSVIVLAAH